jgi:UDPglucose--hexose-1-phosphate uridylyltransferase
MAKKHKSEIRKAYLLNKYVIITPGRAKRPRDIKEETIIRRSGDCPFCPDNIDKKNIVDKIPDKKDKKKWSVLSIKNIFPAVTLDNKCAYGTQEVIIENRHHSKELADLSLEGIQNVLEMYAKRTAALEKNKKLDYILCFKNQGSKAGASIVHAHSQVFATDILPPEIHDELGLAQAYQIKNGICPYCDILNRELRTERKIYEDKHIGAFTPYASEYHYEAWVFPKRHVDNIARLNKTELKSLARSFKLIL